MVLYGLSIHGCSSLCVQISKVLLCIAIPGDEDSLYQYVDQLKDRQL